MYVTNCNWSGLKLSSQSYSIAGFVAFYCWYSVGASRLLSPVQSGVRGEKSTHVIPALSQVGVGAVGQFGMKFWHAASLGSRATEETVASKPHMTNPLPSLTTLFKKTLPLPKAMHSLLSALILSVGIADSKAQSLAPPYGPGLLRAGPINKTHHFPDWYQDKSGVAFEFGTPLTQGELAGGWVLLLPINTIAPETYVYPPANPLTFLDEHFYWHAAAKDKSVPVPTTVDPSGFTGILVERGHEAAFASGPLEIDGDQIVFTRIRVFLRQVPYNGDYVLETPYKTYYFPGLLAGDRLFNTDDYGVAQAPEGFQNSLTGPIGRYLLPAATEGGAELPPVVFEGRQYAGDPALTYFVTGSPLNKNFVRLTGPNGFVWSTNQFNVTGRYKTGPVPSNVTLQRASKFDSLGDQRVDSFATAAPTLQPRVGAGPILPPTHSGLTIYPAPPSVDAQGNLALPTGVGGLAMANNGPLGKSLFLQMPLSSIPPFITAQDDAGFITSVPVVDTVIITKANYDSSTKTLTVDAATANLNSSPTFTLVGVDGVGADTTFTSSIQIPNLNAPPSRVIVLSSQGGQATVEVTCGLPLSAFNHPPVAVNDNAATTATTPVVIPVLVNDVDPDADRLTIDSVVQPANGVVAITDLNTTLTFTANIGVSGPVTFTYRATDRRGGFSVATVTVYVDGLPVAAADTAVATAGRPTVINVLANDSDPDNDPLTVISVTTAQVGGVALGTASITDAGKSVTYTPNSGSTGIQTLSYTITDGRGGIASAQVSVTVNSPPVANSDSIVDLNGQPVQLNVLANDTDIDGDPITIIAVESNPRATIVINGGTSITFTPLAGVLPIETFNYTISDGRGGQATGLVAVIQDRSPVAANDNVFANSGGVPNTLNVLANDTDPDGNPLTISGVTQPANATVAVSADKKTLVFTFNPNAQLNSTFTYTITDGLGGDSTATVNVTLNNAPVANPDTGSAQAGQPVTINVLANDTDADADVLRVISTTVAGADTVQINADNTITYTPGAASTLSPRTFSYTVSDGKGGTSVGQVTVTVNNPPLAVADSVSTTLGASVTIDVVGNDSDPNGNPLTVTAVTQPTGGTVSIVTTGIQAGKAVFVTPNVTGVLTFTYTISDGRGGTAVGTVTLNVAAGANRVPLAVNDSATTAGLTPVTVSVLNNDSDPDGDPLTITAVTQPAAGTLVISQVGKAVTFTPNANSSITPQSFNYTISDGRGGTATATVSVKVNDAPTITQADYTVSNSRWTLAGTSGPSATVTLTAGGSTIAVVTADTRGSWKVGTTVTIPTTVTTISLTSSQGGTTSRLVTRK
jgi:hypothetical protein